MTEVEIDSKYFGPEYVTYRLLETDGERGAYLRQVAKLLKPYKTALMFAEQFEGMGYNGPGSEDELWRVAVAWPIRKGSGSSWTQTTNRCQVTVERHVFDQLYGYHWSKTGCRRIKSATALRNYEEKKSIISFSHVSYGETDHSIGIYMPWWGWLSRGRAGTAGTFENQSYDMLFLFKGDAIRYAAQMMALMAEFESHPKLADLIKKVG